MNFMKPRSLKRGDTVGIFAPSDWFSRSRFDQGIGILRNWGLKVKYGKHLFERVDDFMAGSPKDRGEDLRNLIFDNEVSALWAAEGGYAATDIRYVIGDNEVNYLMRNPKWLVGYSDIGVLTNAFFSKGLSSVMGPNIWGLSYWNDLSHKWLRDLLFGEKLDFPTEGEILIGGEAKGRLLASNLDSLAVSFGTKYDPILHGENDLVLIIEDWKQDLSTLQRQVEMILDHERFDRVKGMVLGRFSMMLNESYPIWANKNDLGGLIKEKLLLRKRIPLVRVNYIGHPSYSNFAKGAGRETSLAVPIGVKVSLLASEKINISCLE